MSVRGASGRGSSKRPFKLSRASEAIEPLARDLGLEPALKLYRIRKAWTSAVGNPLALHTWPASLASGRLTVHADNPAWLQQAGYFREKMTDKLASFGVRELRFRLGRIARDAPSHKPTPLRRREPDHEFIESLLKDIEDEDLRDSVRRAAKKSLAEPIEEEG